MWSRSHAWSALTSIPAGESGAGAARGGGVVWRGRVAVNKKSPCPSPGHHLWHRHHRRAKVQLRRRVAATIPTRADAPPRVAWPRRTRFDWLGVGFSLPSPPIPTLQKPKRGQTKYFSAEINRRMRDKMVDSIGDFEWRVRQDLNLQPSDPKSEALSN